MVSVYSCYGDNGTSRASQWVYLCPQPVSKVPTIQLEQADHVTLFFEICPWSPALPCCPPLSQNISWECLFPTMPLSSLANSSYLSLKFQARPPLRRLPVSQLLCLCPSNPNSFLLFPFHPLQAVSRYTPNHECIDSAIIRCPSPRRKGSNHGLHLWTPSMEHRTC